MSMDKVASFSRKNPVGIACAVVSVVLAGVIFFRSDLVPAAEDELGKQTAEAERYAANVQNAAQLKEQLEALLTARKEADARLLRASQTLNNYQYFYKLESETGMKMTVLTQGLVGKSSGKNAFVAVPFSITVQGTMSQVLDYLRRLESGAHYVRVMNVTCGLPPSDRGGPVTLALNLEMLGLP